ncbi:MinD/ParA family ATP-binding protein [Leptolyngbya sp. AN02str]|uniref:MinD/ParA family ATP-binding protein n=1 Tax=Leptolyngbya sp. AN02str TaxID=3423363 RepID=UPI003D320581
MAKVLSFHAAQHGVGKSHIVANLAVILAKYEKRVGILDASAAWSDFHPLFRVEQSVLDPLLNYYLWIAEQPNSDSFQAVSSCPQGRNVILIGSGVEIIPAKASLKDLESLLLTGYSVTALSQRFEVLVERLALDYLLLDAPVGFGHLALFLMTLSDKLGLVATLKPQDFEWLAVMLEVAQRLAIPQHFLVMNQVLNEYVQASVQTQIESVFQSPVLGMLPLASEIMEMGSCDLFCLRYPNHPITQTMEAIAHCLIED